MEKKSTLIRFVKSRVPQTQSPMAPFPNPDDLTMNQDNIDHMSRIFKASWDIYETILAHDYMAHKRIFPIVERACVDFSVQSGNHPVSVWELGCGSAHYSSQMLRSSQLASYTGIDLAPNVLEVAREKLKVLGCPITLLAMDLFDAVQTTGQEADLVFSSYALHHIHPVARKAEFFKSLFNKVRPGGIFVLVDLFRDDGQSREEFLAGYEQMIRTQWTLFQGAVLEEVVSHCRTHDFPEDPTELNRVAVRAGWSNGSELCRFGFHRVFLFSKPRL